MWLATLIGVLLFACYRVIMRRVCVTSVESCYHQHTWSAITTCMWESTLTSAISVARDSLTAKISRNICHCTPTSTTSNVSTAGSHFGIIWKWRCTSNKYTKNKVRKQNEDRHVTVKKCLNCWSIVKDSTGRLCANNLLKVPWSVQMPIPENINWETTCCSECSAWIV